MKMARTIVGLAGLKGSGKDTVADFLVKNHGFRKYAFAEPLKECVQSLFLMTQNQMHGNAKDEIDPRYNLTPRQVLQKFGTDFVREQVSQTFWVDRFSYWLMSCPHEKIVVSDVRFPNESQKLHELGGKVYLVHRPGVATNDNHVSERPETLPAIDGHIHNDKHIEALYGHAAEVMGL